jgi:hypothetical protein
VGPTTFMPRKKSSLQQPPQPSPPKKISLIPPSTREPSPLKKNLSLPPTTQQACSGRRTSSPVLRAAAPRDTSPQNASAVVLAVRVSSSQRTSGADVGAGDQLELEPAQLDVDDVLILGRCHRGLHNHLRGEIKRGRPRLFRLG